MNDKTKIERKTYDIETAGRMLGLGKNASYNAAHRGEIPTIRIGGRILVPKAAFEKMLEATK
jgi:excisionase family DNA binding protein